MNPVILATMASAVGAAVGKVLLSLITSLLTETVLKKVIILSLEKVVDKTQNDMDNELLRICKEAWEVKPVDEQPK